MALLLPSRELVLGLIAGCMITITLLALGAVTFLWSRDIYGLGHWRLNVKTPFQSMWMNLGLWTTDDGKPIEQFDVAAQALLEKVVQAAGLLVKDELGKVSANTQNSVAVLDVGIGCGDQTVALAELIQARSRPRFRYVGLTLNAIQLEIAQERLDGALASKDGNSAMGLSENSFSLFQADAAKPESWSRMVRTSVDHLEDEAFSERWFMALDCLYHFSPSRKPIFKHAAQTLDAHVMAFDLILNENASMWDTIAVRLLGLVLSCPLYTFLTEEQYRDQLVECGYDRARIEIRDISDDVFAGLSGHLRKQELSLARYGISLAGYNLTASCFEWFHRTRVVKAAIVIGRTKNKGSNSAA